MRILKLTIFLSIYIFSAGCEKDTKKKERVEIPYGTCIEGEVIGWQNCYSSGSLIKIQDLIIGDTVFYVNEQEEIKEYDNVVITTGLYPKGKIFFIAREYNPDEDYKLFWLDSIPQILPANCIPYSAPNIVITDYSQTKCL